MTTTLITGANNGLGKPAARRLVAAGHIVLLGSRDRDRGRAAAAVTILRNDVIDGNRGTQAVEQGTDAIANMATIGADGPTGGFFDAAGPVDW